MNNTIGPSMSFEVRKNALYQNFGEKSLSPLRSSFAMKKF
jgi:hypothetical protein